MKLISIIALASLASLACLRADEAPRVFEGLLKPNTPVQAQIGVVLPPQEIDKYVAKVASVASKDPKWFREYSGQFKPSVPLPYDERLGLTREEYDLSSGLTLCLNSGFPPRSG